MTLLETHLEQISLSSAAIAELPFPPPKIFTNALLHHHDITALIRDTESHERALFSVASSEPSMSDNTTTAARRSTVFNLNASSEPGANGVGLIRGQRPTNAVSMLLGGHMLEQMRRGQLGEGREKGEMDVEALLQGAEKLCGVYPILGVSEKIASLRARHAQLSSSIAHYESRVSKQAMQLDRMNHPKDYGAEDESDDRDEEHLRTLAMTADLETTVDDLQREEEEIRELEKKKKGLEDRVSGMERDLGGLLR